MFILAPPFFSLAFFTGVGGVFQAEPHIKMNFTGNVCLLQQD